MDDHPEIYRQLLEEDFVQFCSLAPHSEGKQCALLAFPIKNGEVKGDSWLISSTNRILNDLEVRLVQQVSNQCAIAL